MAKTVKKTAVKKKEVDHVSVAIKNVSKLSWEQRQEFFKRVQEVYTQEAGVRGDGHEFDAKANYV